jgi:hypothetical protein
MRGVTLMSVIMRNLTDLFLCPSPAEPLIGPTPGTSPAGNDADEAAAAVAALTPNGTCIAGFIWSNADTAGDIGDDGEW